MDLSIVQLTNLTKVLPDTAFPIWNENIMTAMPGQRISYQIAMRSSYTMLAETAVSGDFADKVELFRVQPVPVDAPCEVETKMLVPLIVFSGLVILLGIIPGGINSFISALAGSIM